MLESLVSFTLGLINKAGYGGVFILSVLENIGFPIPSEVVVPFSGFLVSIGEFDFWPVILYATLGNFIGSIILYAVGRSGGRWILEKYGRYLFIRSAEIHKGDVWFAKYGGWTVFWGRLIPVIRSLISLPAGVARMDFKKFCAFTFAGSLIWNLGLAYAGIKIGNNWQVLHAYFQKLDMIIVAALLAAVAGYVIRLRLKRRKI